MPALAGVESAAASVSTCRVGALRRLDAPLSRARQPDAV